MEKNVAISLNLNRPVIVFDLETTGLSVTKDRIIQMAYQIAYPDGKNLEACFLINPGMPISKEASEVHGFKDEDLANEPSFQEKSAELFALFSNSFYSGFNVSGFDLPLKQALTSVRGGHLPR
jgi:DNA polymerase-3 subunit epsilon